MQTISLPPPGCSHASNLWSASVGFSFWMLLEAKLKPLCAALAAGAASRLNSPATFTRSRLLPSRRQSLPPPFQLVPSPRGSLNALKPVRLEQSAVTGGQMQVAVAAVGLNFRDVLNVLDMYPGDPGLPGKIHTVPKL